MKNFIQFNTFDKLSTSKGFVLKRIIILAVLVVALVGLYSFTQKGTIDTGAPTITLTSPNGGETLTIGQPTTVTFTTTGEIKDEYNVVIWLNEASAPLATISATTTSYTLTIPESVLIGGDAVAPLEPGSYKIRVALYDGVPCTGFCLPSDVKELASDSSDGMITINKVFTQPFVPAGQTTSIKPSITILSPNGNESYKIGDEVTIKWLHSYLGSSNINIHWCKNVNDSCDKIATNVQNSGTYSWKIPTNFVTGSYKIELFNDDITNKAIDSSDNYFTITN